MSEWIGNPKYGDYYGEDTELFPLSQLLSRQTPLQHPPNETYKTVDGSALTQNTRPFFTNTVGGRKKLFIYNNDQTGDRQFAVPYDTVVTNWDGDMQVYKYTGGENLYRIGTVTEGEFIQDSVTIGDAKHWIAFIRNDIYWERFGIHQVELTEDTPILASIWDRVSLRVNERFYDRFIAAETLEQWQRRLQVTTDRVAPRYERAMAMYSSVTDTEVRAYTETEYLDVKDRGRTAETPDTGINSTEGYAGTVSDSTRTGKVRQTVSPDGGVLESVNANIEAWRDLENELVGEYSDCFLSTIWY